ncbi:hypothetical protein BU24DRAFT_454213 [Aaosphaeria arxii CBS 175.79]|uniref:Uncharacterized protein n=1 Tax=Aaosphaeria arxii CBS 175.79 TaxID=1450172 RepID=A0A6A5XFU2_9PLEO|nr:uncharacterized protein BU24DRAFT_454213 [Aaosphaeria arxii CBS 175.79]KAF2011716.1 hypothetical protein BU24DRAFT_454213 [Aaosphaeria arxii CBS 175.79]
MEGGGDKDDDDDDERWRRVSGTGGAREEAQMEDREGARLGRPLTQEQRWCFEYIHLHHMKGIDIRRVAAPYYLNECLHAVNVYYPGNTNCTAPFDCLTDPGVMLHPGTEVTVEGSSVRYCIAFSITCDGR